MPANAPVDPRSALWIADSMNPSNTQPFLKFPALRRDCVGCGQPIYYADAQDPLHHIVSNDGRFSFDIRIPNEAQPAPTSDSQLVVFDQTTNQVIGMHRATRNSNGRFTFGSVDRYFLNSEGIARKAGGTEGNFGHRGINAAVRAIRFEEVMAGAINHRLECFWHATADQYYWPMTNAESGKGGIVPEGVVARIKPSVNLDAKPLSRAAYVIAKALQDYGCVVGDNSGSGNTIKIERANWSGILTIDALQSVPFSEWEFVRAGYNPAASTATSTPTTPSSTSVTAAASPAPATSPAAVPPRSWPRREAVDVSTRRLVR